MEKSFFFNAVVTDGVPDRSYSAEDFAERESWLLSDGVLGGKSLLVEGMSAAGVYVHRGAACISGYTYLNTEMLYLAVTAGDSEYDRIDTVALKLDLNSRKISAVVLKGLPSANPEAMAMPDTDSAKYLPIADILVYAGTNSVEPEDITDRRVLAGYASAKDDMLKLLEEYLGEIDPVNSWEVGMLRKVISIVSDENGSDTVLCGDGAYREIPVIKREVAIEYTIPGTYTFLPADHPSEDGVYDIEVQGAGGAGGSHNGDGARGGGGGGGAFIVANKVNLRRNICTVVVGKGGDGIPGGTGEDGGYSAFDGFIADGGAGGGGGTSAAGGNGGTGMFCGEKGADGNPADDGNIYTHCGKGGYSQYGDGALSAAGTGSVQGIDAKFPGAGGSGGTSVTGTFGKAGGRGGDGCVVIYKYVRANSEETE